MLSHIQSVWAQVDTQGALRGEKTIHEIAAKYQVHPTQATQWRRQLIEQAASVFAGKSAGTADAAADREAPVLPVTRQCELLALLRSSVYYERGPLIDDADLTLMRLLDEVHLKYPFMGSWRLRDELKKLGHTVNCKRVQRLMRLMGLEALYPSRRTSAPHPAHRVFPYLLRELVIDRPGQVRAADVTYIPMRRGFLYLVAIADWASRAVLSLRLSTTMEADFCVEALEGHCPVRGSADLQHRPGRAVHQ